MPEVSGSAGRWLLLVHQLPPRPSNLRVHIWRRLQQIGAVSLRNSIYVLPNTAETREDFDWIRAEITGRGGQVSLLVADVVDGYTDDELEDDFRQAIAREYTALVTHVDRMLPTVSGKPIVRRRAAIRRDVAKLRDRWLALKARDFFECPRAAVAQAAVERLERAVTEVSSTSKASSDLDARFYRRRVWLTRPRPGIDRMASAWLIRRFIAPDAKFAFGSLPASKGQIPFDMPDVEFGHHADDCTYETLVRRFAITDAAALRVGQIVHDLDLKESRYGLPDTASVGRLVEGLRATIQNDHRLLEGGMTLIEALHRALSVEGGSPRKIRRRSAGKSDKRARRAS
jgi:hypothetical protein